MRVDRYLQLNTERLTTEPTLTPLVQNQYRQNIMKNMAELLKDERFYIALFNNVASREGVYHVLLNGLFQKVLKKEQQRMTPDQQKIYFDTLFLKTRCRISRLGIFYFLCFLATGVIKDLPFYMLYFHTNRMILILN